MYALFFQKHWYIVTAYVTGAIFDFSFSFQSSMLLNSLNYTCTALIPKIKSLEVVI